MTNEAPSAPARLFPFFQLPRELRDTVYDHLEVRYPAMTRKDRKNIYAIEASVETIATQARLVSRQFKLEVEDRIRSTTRLTLRDHEDYAWSNHPKLFQTVAEAITDIDITLLAFCDDTACVSDCTAAEELEKHKIWIEELVDGMPNLRNIDVLLNIEWCVQKDYTWPNAPHGHELQQLLSTFIEMTSLGSLNVRRFPRDSVEAPYDPEASYELWVSWDKEKGWQAPQKKGGDAL